MIRFQSVTKRFGEKMILDRFSFAFELGRTTCLIGPSGCGKTTLLRLASGLLSPDGGLIEGNQMRFSFVFQEDRLLPWFSALDNITCLGVCDEKAAKWLRAFGLHHEMRSPIGSLSGGMQRRVALARAMAYEADAFHLDEPFRGMDAQTARQAACAMKPALRGKTALLITHHPAEAFDIADRFVAVSGLPFRVEREAEKKRFKSAEALLQWAGDSGGAPGGGGTSGGAAP